MVAGKSPRSRMCRLVRRDEGQVMVMEAFLVAFIFIGAASYATLAASGGATSEQRTLPPVAVDGLGALMALRGADGRPVVDALVRDAWRCAEDAASPACASPAGAAAASRLRAYLPPGAHYELIVRDAAATITLKAAASAGGTSVGASAAYVPEWSYGLARPTASCRDPGASARVEAVFVQNGNTGLARRVELVDGGVPATRAGAVWVATHASADAAIQARAYTADADIAAGTSVAECALHGHAADLQAAAAASTYSIAPSPDAPILPGQALEIRHDLSAAAGLVATSLDQARLDVYSPAAGDAPLWTVALGEDLAGATSWSVPPSALHGCYPTSLRATWLVADGGETMQVETQRLGETCVALPSGHVPAVPMHRLTLRAWMLEWSG